MVFEAWGYYRGGRLSGGGVRSVLILEKKLGPMPCDRRVEALFAAIWRARLTMASDGAQPIQCSFSIGDSSYPGQ